MRVESKTKGSFENAEQWLSKISKRDPTNALNKIASAGEKSLSSNTPKDTGATAAGWKGIITSDSKGSEVAWINDAHKDSKLNVAKLIDQGHGTRTGGYVAPKPYIEKSMESIWKTAGDDIVKELID